MDAHVQLALIEKARRVFATDETFLSFPLLSPLSFAPKQIAAMNAPASAADYATAADFARIVNFVPRDIVATIDGETFLWDIYGDLLARAQVATGEKPSAADQAAAAMLYIADDHGTRTESPAYRQYRQYRDAWIVSQENYNAQRLTAESAADEAARTQWTTTDEPALRAAIAAAKTAWEQTGHKVEIEAALASYERISAIDPQSSWREWQANFNPDIDMVGDPSSGGRYAPTGFSPRDLSGDDAWLHLDLSSDEMAKLVSGAPPELRVVLGENSASDFEHVGFDYRSVAVTRPWFRSSALTARTWRIPPTEEALSDGADPPSGRCPAYVCALVFVRNVRFTRRAAAPKASGPDGLQFTLQAQLLTKRSLVVDSALVARMQVAPALRAATPAQTDARSGQATVAFKRLSQQSFKMAAPAVPRAAAVHPIARTAVHRAVQAPAAARVRRHRKLGPRVVKPVRAAPAPQPALPTTPAPAAPSGDVSVLAFICKRLPKAPDPRPDLKWS